MLKDAGGESEGATLASVVEGGSPRVLACARCRRVITSNAHRTTMNGSHEHVFVNPDGEKFRIGCFTEAPGLLRVGPSTPEFTWFAGYSWQGEICASCRVFLGWLYRKGEHRFHGLVLDGLVEIDEG